MSLRSHVVRQFARPEGPAGRVAGWVMAHRPSNRARNLWTVDLLQLQPGHRVLEIGYGPGIAVQHAARFVTAGQIVGVDHSPLMRDQATARNREAVHEGRVRLLVGSIQDLPEDLLDDVGPLDAIFSVNVAMFWSDPAEVLRRLHGILNPGGIVATTHQPRHRGARSGDAAAMADRLVAWTTAAGFTEVRSECLDLRPVPAVCVLGHRAEVC